MEHLYSYKRLIHTEIATLIGMLFKNDIDVALPKKILTRKLIKKTGKLLDELHNYMLSQMILQVIDKKSTGEEPRPFANGVMMREAIFYSSESAYDFQYLEFASKKYSYDNEWLLVNKGFSIDDVEKVIRAICSFQVEKINYSMNTMRRGKINNFSFLHMFIFTVDNIVKILSLDEQVIRNVLDAFTPDSSMHNQDFNALNDFNITNAYPIIRLNNDEFLLLQQHSLVEAFYETPFYWMISDGNYCNQAMKNRGDFTENICKEKLQIVFGESRVFQNIDIIDKKNKKAGEIDVLVVFSDRAIIVQAKSKRLTIEARKGNDLVIKDDFKKSIQNSYNQALTCSKLINDKSFYLINKNGGKINISRKFTEIFIFCIISDHYPALNIQVQEYINYQTTEIIRPPFVADIFFLDVLTEMLKTPLHFLSYINRRTSYFGKILADEHSILSYHLLSNLWIDDEFTELYLENDMSVDLDIAMLVRRSHIKGNDTPEGILTKYKDTPYDKIIQEIERIEDPTIINIGFFLLKLSEDAVDQINDTILKLLQFAKNNGSVHGATLGFGDMNAGLTLHVNNDSLLNASRRLEAHCQMRKYSSKANTWFGIVINSDLKLINALQIEYEWEWSKEFDDLVKKHLK